MLRDLEEEKNFSQEMVKRIADMERQNDYLQRKIQDNMRDARDKDNEIEKQRVKLQSLEEENSNWKKQIDKYKDAYESHNTLQLINECKTKSKLRQIAEVEKEEGRHTEEFSRYKQKQRDQDYDLRMKANLFNASRRAVESTKRSGQPNSSEPSGRQSIRAELDAIRLGKSYSPMERFSIEEAARII